MKAVKKQTRMGAPVALALLLTLSCKGDPCADLEACCVAINEEYQDEEWYDADDAEDCNVYRKIEPEVCEDLQDRYRADDPVTQLPPECDF